MDDKDLVPMVPREVLLKEGTSAVACLAGGALLMVMTFGIRFRVLGTVLSLAALALGIGALVSRDKEDKKPGMVLTAAGALGMIVQFGIPLLRPIAVFGLGLGAFGLFAAGIWKGIAFLKGLRSRR